VNPVLFYHPDGFQVARKDLKGRHSAGESFLTAFLQQAEDQEIYALCFGKDGPAAFTQAVKEAARPPGRPLTARPLTRGDVEALRRQGVLNLPAPGLDSESETRAFLGDDAYAICGVTHTISSREMLDSVARMATSPVQPWDALICTSDAVHEALSGVLDGVEAHLRQRLGATRFTRPMMPVVPLGVHAGRFTHKPADRQRWREKLGLAEDVTAVLFFGRLSIHAKASPFQLAQAVEAAAKASGRKFALLFCGWFNDDFQRRAFLQTARAMAPSVPFHAIDGREEGTRFSIWAAADIFCSLSDNIQESFGLTVIEAMAAGLPVVVSNWDGYRAAVRDGENGVMIDSYLPKASLADAGYRYVSGADTYDVYIAGVSQLCFVDLAQTTQWLVRLATDANLRKKLGDAGRRTAQDDFDWKAVLPRYKQVWREQLERLRREKVPPSMAWQRHDPAKTFAGFPSHALSAKSLLARGPHFAQWGSLPRQSGIILNAGLLTGNDNYLALGKLFSATSSLSIGDVLGAFPEAERAGVLRALHWAIKVGLLAHNA
jgi:glycosyltransferase involved in cell wall biosynthesis